MKKRILSLLILLAILSTTMFGMTSNIVFAQAEGENENYSQSETYTINESNNKTYLL